MKLSERQIDKFFLKSDRKREKGVARHKDWIVESAGKWRIRNPYFGFLLDEFKTRYQAKLHRLKYLIKNNQL